MLNDLPSLMSTVLNRYPFVLIEVTSRITKVTPSLSIHLVLPNLGIQMKKHLAWNLHYLTSCKI